MDGCVRESKTYWLEDHTAFFDIKKEGIRKGDGGKVAVTDYLITTTRR